MFVNKPMWHNRFFDTHRESCLHFSPLTLAHQILKVKGFKECMKIYVWQYCDEYEVGLLVYIKNTCITYKIKCGPSINGSTF